jgi:hypothetical protein
VQKFSELMRGGRTHRCPGGAQSDHGVARRGVSHDGLGEVSQLTAIGQILTAAHRDLRWHIRQGEAHHEWLQDR